MSDYCEHDNYASDCKEPGCNERAHPDGKGAMRHTCVDQSTELSTLRDRVQKLEGALRQVCKACCGLSDLPGVMRIEGIARQALSPNGTEGDTQPTSG